MFKGDKMKFKMKFESIDANSIRSLMDIFYAKVRVDKGGLGEIFNNKIGTDDANWSDHKEKIANFWEGLLLGSGNFRGNPMRTHIDLAPFPRELFAVWLKLFKESLECVYKEPEHQRVIFQRAEMIAQRFQYVLYESEIAY